MAVKKNGVFARKFVTEVSGGGGVLLLFLIAFHLYDDKSVCVRQKSYSQRKKESEEKESTVELQWLEVAGTMKFCSR